MSKENRMTDSENFSKTIKSDLINFFIVIVMKSFKIGIKFKTSRAVYFLDSPVGKISLHYGRLRPSRQIVHR